MTNERKQRGESQSRKSRGRAKQDEAIFPVGPARAELPDDYVGALREIKTRVEQARLRVVTAANSAMILLYWDIGRMLLQRTRESGWGAKVLDRLSDDLKKAFPDMKGLSARNLRYMRDFAEKWSDLTIVQRAVAKLPWRNIVALLDRVRDDRARQWYAEQAALNGWSQSVLILHIKSRAHARQGQAVTNFADTLPPADSDLAAQIFKDPYLFDFLGTADPRREREVEASLVDHIQRFLLEMGSGFAFVGRQVPLEVGDQDFRLDLLFYHLKLRCYVVVELKAVPFDPAFVGQLNVYLSAVDDLLRDPADKPTIGLLMCRSKNRIVVEYALRELKRPIGVAEWETRIVNSLPDELKGSLPTVEEIERELEATGEE